MNRTALIGSCLIALCLAAPVLADDAEISALIRQMKAAARSGDLEAAKAAFASTKAHKKDAKSAKRLAAALGSCVKSSNKKHTGMAIAAMDALGELRVPGSGRQVLTLLKPPRKVAYERIGLHIVAIRTAGKIHDEHSLPTLERLLSHHSTDLAIAASKALAEYRVLEERARMKLMDRLVRTLSGYERKRAKVKSHDRREHFDKVTGYLIDCLANLSDNPVATTASDWTTWLKTEKKRRQALATK